MKKNLALVLTVCLLVGILTGVFAGCTHSQKQNKKRTKVTIPLNTVGNTLDAHAWTNNVDQLVLAQVYESMYYVEDDATMTPRLAERYDASNDGMEYTYHLRKGVKFHNGEEMKASDVAFSYQRCIDNLFRQEFISNLKSVEVVDDYTVKFKLKMPDSVFPITMNMVYVVSEKLVTELGEKYGRGADLAGTGPYYLESYDMNNKIVLKAFSDYYRTEAAIKTVEFVPISDTATMLLSFQRGQFDICEVSPSNWKEIADSGNYSTIQYPSLHLSYIGINVSKKDSPLYDQRVRQAIAYCINKQQMIDLTTDGFAVVAKYMMNPDYFDGAVDTGVYYSYDIDKAKDLMKEAGYADGFDCTISASTARNKQYVKMAEVLKENLADIGINADIVTGDLTDMSSSWRKDHAYDIFVHGCSFDYAYTDIKWMINPPQITHVQLNDNEYIDWKYVRDMFNKGAAGRSVAEREQIYGELDKYLTQIAAYIPVMNEEALYAWSTDLNAQPPIHTYQVYNWSWNN